MLQTARSQYAVANTVNISKSGISRLWNRYQQTQNILTIDSVQVVSGQRQEYRIDSSVTRLYEIDLKRQIKLLQTFIRLLVSEVRVRRVEIVFMRPSSCSPAPGCAYLDNSSHCPKRSGTNSHKWPLEKSHAVCLVD